MQSDYLTVLVTVADPEAGVALGQMLVEERLAACVQVIPGGLAIYRWQGEIHTDHQTQLLIKTRRGVWPALQSRILALHDDDVPEILALPVADGLPAYLGWLDDMTATGLPAEADEVLPLLPPAIWLDYADVYPRGQHTVSGNLQVLRGVLQPAAWQQPRYRWSTCRRRTRSGSRHYPVLYMHDGQNLFDGATSYAGEWYVDETMEGLASQGIEAIVVGIPNIGSRRFNEYIPFPAPDLPDAQGDLYVAFIADTLKPMIDRDFRTLPGRTTTGIMGSSLGGLISLYAFFKRPDTFGLTGGVSPALRWGKQGIFPFVTLAASAPGQDLHGRGDGGGHGAGVRSAIAAVLRRALRPTGAPDEQPAEAQRLSYRRNAAVRRGRGGRAS